jgi:hypothetical protein
MLSCIVDLILIVSLLKNRNIDLDYVSLFTGRVCSAVSFAAIALPFYLNGLSLSSESK